MFFYCFNIIEIDLSEFNSSQVTTMYDMFAFCISLTSINLSNLDTSKATNMNSMFSFCSSLASLDLSNFDTSKVTDMIRMFWNSSSLISLNLSNFNTLNVENMYSMFENCSSLTSLDLFNFNTSKVINMNNMFYSCINLEYINLYNFDESKLEHYTDIFFDVPENIVICTNGNINEKIIFQNIKNIKCHIIDCSNDWKSKRKKIIYNDECIDSCNNSTLYKYEYNGKCYENCNYYYYLDNDNNFHCTFNFSCLKEYPKLAENKNECFQNDIKEIIKNILDSKKEKLNEEGIKVYDDILKIIEKKFTSENYDTSNLDNGEEEIIYTEKLYITLSAYENQKNEISNNMTKIDLGECEYLLRNFYNISYNESLYIKKIDIQQEGMKTLKVEYNVYAKLYGKNLIKLNLTICEKTKISILIPIVLSDNLDKYNINSGYYNDICYTKTSEE